MCTESDLEYICSAGDGAADRRVTEWADDEHRTETSTECSPRRTLDTERTLRVSLTSLGCSDEAKFGSKEAPEFGRKRSAEMWPSSWLCGSSTGTTKNYLHRRPGPS